MESAPHSDTNGKVEESTVNAVKENPDGQTQVKNGKTDPQDLQEDPDLEVKDVFCGISDQEDNSYGAEGGIFREKRSFARYESPRDVVAVDEKESGAETTANRPPMEKFESASCSSTVATTLESSVVS